MDEARKNKAAGGRAAALGTCEIQTEAFAGFEEEIDWNDKKWEEYSVPQILATFRKNNLKQKGRGKGKDGGKGKGPRKCYECDSEEYIAANCPVRAERVQSC